MVNDTCWVNVAVGFSLRHGGGTICLTVAQIYDERDVRHRTDHQSTATEKIFSTFTTNRTRVLCRSGPGSLTAI